MSALQSNRIQALGIAGSLRQGSYNRALLRAAEYNHSISGVLKNALDWASRPPSKTPLRGMPVAIMGATTGSWGTVRAQMHLRQLCLDHAILAVSEPGVLVAGADEKFDEAGRLTHNATRHFVGLLMEALLEWTQKVR